jgi:polyhydroxyalkanoate synthesis regulator phasin
MTKATETKSNVNPTEFARKVWLAGVGAYGKAYEDAQERFEKLSSDRNELFDTLVQKGEEIENTAQETFEKVRTETAATIEDRIAKVRENITLPFPKATSDDRVEKLELEIAALKRKVATLSKTAKAPAKKAPVKKAPVKKAAKRKAA